MSATTKKEVTLAPNFDVPVFSIKYLAESLRRGVQTVTAWEKNRRFPKPILDLGDGLRWYTANEIEAFTRLADTHQIGGWVPQGHPFFNACRAASLEIRAKLTMKIKEKTDAAAQEEARR